MRSFKDLREDEYFVHSTSIIGVCDAGSGKYRIHSDGSEWVYLGRSATAEGSYDCQWKLQFPTECIPKGSSGNLTQGINQSKNRCSTLRTLLTTVTTEN